jgi:hypothetical protein
MTVEEFHARRARLDPGCLVSILTRGPHYERIGYWTGEVRQTERGPRTCVEFAKDDVGWFRADEVSKMTCQAGRRSA